MVIRRLSSLLLVVALGFSSVSLCPKGNCPLVKKSAHDCCEKGPGFNAPDCCPDAAARTAPWLVSAGAGDHHVPVLRAVVVPVSLPEPPTRVAMAFRTVARHHGLAPPGTLIAQHTSLLL